MLLCCMNLTRMVKTYIKKFTAIFAEISGSIFVDIQIYHDIN